MGRLLLIILLAVTVLTSGCVSNSVSDPGGSEDEPELEGQKIGFETIDFKQSDMIPVIEGGLISTRSYYNGSRALLIENRSQLVSLNYDRIAEETNNSTSESIRNTNLRNKTILVVQTRSSSQCSHPVKTVAKENQTITIDIEENCSGGNSLSTLTIETLIIKINERTRLDHFTFDINIQGGLKNKVPVHPASSK
ncbi:hypothetical protein [Halobellus rubicundus]|uniref:Lipoprotein n=1 Tax=Halobellus rubicundus TaxID=2996466 RepID=A0ABD5M826_9EURY